MKKMVEEEVPGIYVLSLMIGKSVLQVKQVDTLHSCHCRCCFLNQSQVSDFDLLFHRTLKMASSWMSMSRCLSFVISCPRTLN